MTTLSNKVSNRKYLNLTKSKLSLNLTLLVSSIAWSLPIQAAPLDDIHLKNTTELQSTTPNLVRLPIDNALFLYGQDASEFDLEAYLSSNAPILLDYQETISNWAGFYSINPKIVLALMESYSAIISEPEKKKLLNPFGNLSAKSGFSEQLQAVLFQLSHSFYQYELSQLQQLNHKTQQQVSSTGALFAATAALNSLTVKGPEKNLNSMSNKSSDYFSTEFSELFNSLFNQELMSKNINLLNNTEKSVQSLNGNTPPINMMQLPWRIGYSWRSNGAHSHTGSGYPYSSIDVSYDWPNWGRNTYSVTAAHSGQVNVLSRCQIRVTNANGWATNYYHLDAIQVNNGQYVDANTKLGVYASNRNTALCQGGSSTGPHLHFSLLKNGRYMSLQGANFGEFKVNVGNYNYDNSCNRFYFSKLNSNGYQCAWSQMYNSGTY